MAKTNIEWANKEYTYIVGECPTYEPKEEE